MKDRLTHSQWLRTKCTICSKESIIADMIGNGKTVLDCGCGNGRIARILKEAGCGVVGIEIDSIRSKVASQSCERVIVGNLEDDTILRKLGNRVFDCVLFSDVLEHLVNPGETITRCVRFLKTGSHLIVSLPNTAYWRIRLHLSLGRWDYQDEGPLDKTHLHFFTLETSLKLFSQAGLEVVETRVPHDPRPAWLRRLVVKAVHRLTSPNFHAAGFVFKLRPQSSFMRQ